MNLNILITKIEVKKLKKKNLKSAMHHFSALTFDDILGALASHQLFNLVLKTNLNTRNRAGMSPFPSDKTR